MNRAFVLFFVLIVAAVLVALLPSTLVPQGNSPNNRVPIFTNQCGVEDSACNVTIPVLPQLCPFPFRVPGDTTREQYWTTFNYSICPIETTYLSMEVYVNLTTFTVTVPDNVTLAARVLFPNLVRAVIPGALTTLVNVTFPPASMVITVTAQLTNLTMFEVGLPLLTALQYGTYRLFWNLPAVPTSWNHTIGVANPVPATPICTLSNMTCPDTQFCVNWLSNAVCMCDFPSTVRWPGTTVCVPNPCYQPANGGCTELSQCQVNFNAASNHTCL